MVRRRRLGEDQGTWENPNVRAQAAVLTTNEGVPVGFTGCEAWLVCFEPSIALTPETSYANTASGLSVHVRMSPQVEGVTASNIKGTSFVFPEGLVLNPGQATGLMACQSSEETLGWRRRRSE